MWERCLGRFALRSHRQALRLWSVCVLQALTVRESGAACTQAVSALVLRLLYERGRIIVVGCRSSVPLFLSVFVLHSSRSEEHTSELQSLMRISYAVCCLKKKT